MRETVIKIKGMVCSGCENRVKNVLKELRGVKEVEANHNKGEVKITSSDRLDKEILKKRIEDLGFEFVEVVKEN